MSNLRFTGAEMIIEPGIKSGLKKYEKDKMDGREMIRQNVQTVQHFSIYIKLKVAQEVE